MKLVFLYVGTLGRDYLAEGIKDYLNRIKHYIPVEEQCTGEVKTHKNTDPATRSVAEGKALEAALKPSDDVVLLDERGRSFSSVEFAEFLQKRMNAGSKRLVFAVGGPYGFSPEIRARYPVHLSLSSMTFSHLMIRLLLAEQVYRALTILKNEPYHNP